MAARAVVLGCEGLQLTSWEKGFFAEADPFGFILFQRNCDSPDQVRGLVEALRETVGRGAAPVLIDQEGGRVQRLRPPHWRSAPAPRCFAELALSDLGRASEAVRVNAALLAGELIALGIDVDCVPSLDLRWPGAHEVIGDRSYGDRPDIIAALGRACCEGLLAGGVMPVIKHLPGHGRATVDSHLALPRVATGRGELEGSDFAPFRDLADMPWAMTAHVVYEAIDPLRPATTSATVIDQVIRGFIGFDGLLLSDDLSMQALDGDLETRARDSLDAGCDIALHCNGKREEMSTVAAGCRPLSTAAEGRIAAGRKRLDKPDRTDLQALTAQLDDLLPVA